MATIIFKKWSGADGIEQFIINRTGCKPYSGAGINPRVEKKTTILKSVDETYYYQDDMSDPNNVKYTLFGHNGDQSEQEKMFNEPLLNKDKTHHIYLYRVKGAGKEKEYMWYGKYRIAEKETRDHIGKDRIARKIIVLTLHKVEE